MIEAVEFPINFSSPFSGGISPGGAGLPDMTEFYESDWSYPVIGSFGNCVYPGETLFATGINLDETDYFIWTEGKTAIAAPVYFDSTKAAIPISGDMTKSVMLIWPKAKEKIGEPIRVNAPEVWWQNGENIFSGNSLRIFGTGLFLEGFSPTAYAVYNEKQIRLSVVNANPYQAEILFTDELVGVGEFSVFYHNGSGGRYGWSNEIKVSVAKEAENDFSSLKTFYVDSFGAVANDGADDYSAIQNAVIAAKNSGGGIVKFGAGEYNISYLIDVSGEFTDGIYLCGEGMGKYGFNSRLDCNDADLTDVSGTYTVLKFSDKYNIPRRMLNIKTDNFTMNDITLIGGDDGSQTLNVYAGGSNLRFNRVRMIKTDTRDFNSDTSCSFLEGDIMQFAYKCQNIKITDCEFHGSKFAIVLGDVTGTYGRGQYDDSYSLRNILISDCGFYGYSSSVYKRAADLGKNMANSGNSGAVRAVNVDGMIFESNKIQGYDKENGKIMNRTILAEKTCNNTYIYNNVSKDVGVHPSAENVNSNSGEQYLWHGNAARESAIFNVISSDGDVLTLDTDVPDAPNGDTADYSGSKIQPGVSLGKKFVAYIMQGRGAGQYRVIESVSEDTIGKTAVLKLDGKWKITPDETSIINIFSPFKRNIVYQNTVDNKNVYAKGYKSGAVLFFYDSAENIVAENKFGGLSFGIAANSCFKAPTLWLNVRDNTISGIKEIDKSSAQGGDTTMYSTFFHLSANSVGSVGKSWDDFNSYTVLGSSFRNNSCTDGDVACEVATRRWHRIVGEGNGLENYHGYDKGIVGTVIENNSFTDVSEGVNIGNPSFRTFLKDNKFTFLQKDGYFQNEVCFVNPPENTYSVALSGGRITLNTNPMVGIYLSDKFGKTSEKYGFFKLYDMYAENESVIIALYSANGALADLEIYDKEKTTDSESVIQRYKLQTENLSAVSEIRVFMWDSPAFPMPLTDKINISYKKEG